jgi:competence transcription factor ComK
MLLGVYGVSGHEVFLFQTREEGREECLIGTSRQITRVEIIKTDDCAVSYCDSTAMVQSLLLSCFLHLIASFHIFSRNHPLRTRQKSRTHHAQSR